MTNSTAARNAIIAAAYHTGVKASELAKRWGLSRPRIYAIAHRLGGTLSDSERSRRRGLAGAANARRAHAIMGGTISKRRAAGLPLGRPRMFADDPAKRADYTIIRHTYGAAYAREAMGL